MVIAHLTSKNNPLLKTIRLIASSSHRAPGDLVIAEGVRVLEEVNACGHPIEAVIISEGFGGADKEKELLKAWLTNNVRVFGVDSKLFMSVSDVRTPQGAIALVSVPVLNLDATPRTKNALILFACAIQDPGNLGTLMRTAAATGATLVCTSSGTVSARNPKAIRASAGAFFRLPVVEHISPAAFRRFCEIRGIQAFRTDVREGLPHTKADFNAPCAILLGNESHGIADDVFAGMPCVHIPMAHGMESLNVAMAGTVLFFEALRQRMNR
jgi:TrmH family RNA methyltransferase